MNKIHIQWVRHAAVLLVMAIIANCPAAAAEYNVAAYLSSWNEWSEGSYLEPCERYGMGYLEAVITVFIDEVEAERLAAAGPAPEVIIVKALYGDLPNGTSVDIADKVRASTQGGKRFIQADNDSFGDPAPGRLKELHVEYSRNGKTTTARASEGGSVVFR